jgi:hypothetical protein
MTVKYYKELKDSVQLLKTTSKIINDSISKLPEFKILRFSLKKYDELNFFNPNEIPQNLKYFKISNDTLFCDVYFNSPPGNYYFGKLREDSLNNIFLYFSDPKYLGDTDNMYVTIKMRFQIYLPSKFKLNKVYLDIQDSDKPMFKRDLPPKSEAM